MECDPSKHPALQVFPESGRSRTRTWDLFLIRKTFCPLQSSQLELNPCKHVQQRARKTTGDDWALQLGGPIVAPRPRFEGKASYDPEADIMPTIRSRPGRSGGGPLRACGNRVDGREPRCVVALVHRMAVGAEGGAGRCERAGARTSAQRLPRCLDGIASLSPPMAAGLWRSRCRRSRSRGKPAVEGIAGDAGGAADIAGHR